MKTERFLHANQYHIYGRNEETTKIDILQSYNSKVIEISQNNGCCKVITFGVDWDYSRTTLRHVYEFLRIYGDIDLSNISDKKRYIQKLIKEGKYEKGIVYNVIKYDETMI